MIVGPLRALSQYFLRLRTSLNSIFPMFFDNVLGGAEMNAQCCQITSTPTWRVVYQDRSRLFESIEIIVYLVTL